MSALDEIYANCKARSQAKRESAALYYRQHPEARRKYQAKRRAARRAAGYSANCAVGRHASCRRSQVECDCPCHKAGGASA